jgi:2-polyprenyl-3-methyl-5-hydroxy-6-metoxy-1,4-benzoquinol methylase
MNAAETRAKPASYYALDRADVVDELPLPLGRVLDIGCGAGGVGAALKARGAEQVVGIEADPDAAALARDVLDEVVAAPVEQALASGAVSGRFDTICCYDVLEHLVEPGAVIRGLHGLARPGARLHISVPNARHLSLLRDLVVRGTFGSTDWGHRDWTHLRWFTRSDIERLVEEAGFAVLWARPNVPRGRDRIATRLTFGRAREFLTFQWHLLATRADS